MSKAAKNDTWDYIKRNYQLYLLLIPGLTYTLIFKLLPMYGITLAFKDYNMFAGSNPFTSIFESKWVGFDHFINLFSRSDFRNAFRNTIIISFYKLIFLFPIPIIFAILLNEINSTKFKKFVQQVVYLPHFLSWVIVGGVFVSILGSDGIVNRFISYLGFEKIMFLMDKRVFRSVLVVTSGWKDFGWGSIVYLAAITSIDQEMYEAAIVDGANRFQRMIYVTLPGIMSTIILMLILRIGNILEAGFSQIFVLYSSVVYEVADIIGTYVYRIGISRLDFSFGTAVGLFDSVVSIILVMTANFFARKWSGKSIW